MTLSLVFPQTAMSENSRNFNLAIALNNELNLTFKTIALGLTAATVPHHYENRYIKLIKRDKIGQKLHVFLAFMAEKQN